MHRLSSIPSFIQQPIDRQLPRTLPDDYERCTNNLDS